MGLSRTSILSRMTARVQAHAPSKVTANFTGSEALQGDVVRVARPWIRSLRDALAFAKLDEVVRGDRDRVRWVEGRPAARDRVRLRLGRDDVVLRDADVMVVRHVRHGDVGLCS